MRKVFANPVEIESNKSLFWLREYVRRETRTLPRHPDVFVKDLVRLIFTNKADKAFVERKYRTTYGAVVAPHKVFALENVARALPTDWRNFLWEVVAKGKCLVTVNLSYNEAIEGATLEPFAEAAAGTLEWLCLKNCPGFEGSLEPLRSCRKLKQLFLAGCVQLEGLSLIHI